VRLATDEQAKRGVSQAVHIYHDSNRAYAGHMFFQRGQTRRKTRANLVDYWNICNIVDVRHVSDV
jgi:hypothetical protein